MEPTQQTPAPVTTGGNGMMKATIGVLVVAGVAGAAYYMNQSKATPTPATTDTTPVATTPTPTTPSYVYRDGTFSAEGTYNSPAGKETVQVSLTVQADQVTAATFKGTAVNPASKNYQAKFAQGFEAAVVGKSLDSLALTVVNGSSLTPKGFMDAVAKIKETAHMAATTPAL